MEHLTKISVRPTYARMNLGNIGQPALGKNDGEEPAYPRLGFMVDKTSLKITQRGMRTVMAST
jgi:hypothetical protein